MRHILLALLVPACSGGSWNFETHCPYTTGKKGNVEFCPSDPNSAGKSQLSLTLGTAQEIALFSTSSEAAGPSVANSASDSPAVTVHGPSGENAMMMIATELGDATVTLTDDAGEEYDEVAVHVGKCSGHLGEYGRAVFCGDADGNGQLATPVNSRARITVFTPAYARLDFTGVGASDWSIASPAASASYCDPKYDYCTNIVDLTGVARGSADIGIYDDSGEIDQITVDIIDHW